MTRFVAFIRGINVGGNRKVPMAELSKVFESLGFSHIQTLLQTGNVLFDAPKPEDAAAQRIELEIKERFGFSVSAMVLPLDELRGVAGRDPFRGKTASQSIALYLAVLSDEPRKEPSLPLFSPEKDIEVISRDGLLVFTAGYENGGRFGFPNAFIEKIFGVPATSRNWKTIEKLLK